MSVFINMALQKFSGNMQTWMTNDLDDKADAKYNRPC